jgi:hypothetical protein
MLPTRNGKPSKILDQIDHLIGGSRHRPSDVTGDFCTSRSERESLTRRKAGYAKQEVQGRTDRDVAAAN